jgi:hypothetical protein
MLALLNAHGVPLRVRARGRGSASRSDVRIIALPPQTPNTLRKTGKAQLEPPNAGSFLMKGESGDGRSDQAAREGLPSSAR